MSLFRFPMIHAVLCVVLLPNYVYAQSSCSATNDNGDASCSISCELGQAAECRNGTGSGTPSCECKGTPQALTRYLPKPAAFNILGAGASGIEKTNVLESINQKLARLRDYQLSETCGQERTGRSCYREPCVTFTTSAVAKPLAQLERYCPHVCEDVYSNVCRKVTGKLTATLPFSIEAPPIVVVTEPNWKDIPSEVLGYRETYTNCTSLAQSIIFKHGETVRTGSKVSKTKAVGTTEKIDAKVDFKFTDSFGGGLSVGYSNTVTITDVDEQNQEQTKPLEMTIPLNIASGAKVVMDHKWIRREVPIPYRGTVTLDSSVGVNREGIARVSQVLSNTTERTFAFAGVIQHSTLLEGETRVIETKLSAPDCQANPGFRRVPEPYVGIMN